MRSLAFLSLLLLPAPALAQPSEPSSAREPLARGFSRANAAAFLDTVAVKWTREKNCGSCHTNYPYLMARPVLREQPSAAEREVRGYFEQRVANWHTEKGKPRWDTEVVATAAILAFHDAHTTGKLHPLTKQALDRMWTLQSASATPPTATPSPSRPARGSRNCGAISSRTRPPTCTTAPCCCGRRSSWTA
jgi:squalene-hopene/tetraprenyl-beta-curcumene cyclase